jgi:hypothetical protein
MSKPAVAERNTITATWRTSINGAFAQIERYEDGEWVRVHHGPIADIVALADCIDAARDIAAEKGRARA